MNQSAQAISDLAKHAVELQDFIWEFLWLMDSVGALKISCKKLLLALCYRLMIWSQSGIIVMEPGSGHRNGDISN